MSGEATIGHVEKFLRRKMELTEMCQVSNRLSAVKEHIVNNVYIYCNVSDPSNMILLMQ